MVDGQKNVSAGLVPLCPVAFKCPHMVRRKMLYQVPPLDQMTLMIEPKYFLLFNAFLVIHEVLKELIELLQIFQ